MPRRHVSIAAGLLVAGAARAALAAAAPACPPPEPPRPGPRYFNLRYDEDFSYLDGAPGTYKEDFFDPIKNIRLGDDLRLSIGGESRFRMESETHLDFGTRRQPTQDNLQLYRNLLHFDLRHRALGRVFLQLGSALVGDRQLPPRPFDENRFDVQQLFVDLRPGEGAPLTLRIGRQELQYGRQRFLSALDWVNSRRRFDAAKLMWSAAEWRLDVFYAKPVVVRAEHPDRYNEEFDFYGAYFTHTGITRHGLDVFFFAVDDTGDRVNPNGADGDVSRYTLGSRFWGKTGNWDYEAVLAGQWGHWAGDTIQAWAWTIDGGYTFANQPWKPRLGAAFDMATGDDNPRPGSSVGTFDQLFPLGHAWLGYLDLVGRQNINAFNLNLTAWPVPERLKAQLAWHTFWLQAKEDFLYSAGGAPGRRDPLGNSGREVGQELDVTLHWTIDRHSAVLVGYSHFWNSAFITNTGASEEPDLFYVQYTFQF